MKPSWLMLLAGALLLAGCQSPPATSGAAAGSDKLNKDRAIEITPEDEAFTERRAATGSSVRKDGKSRDPAELTEGDIYELPKFTVTRRGWLNLGLSVVTNTEVVLNGRIEWMRVGVVLPGLPAARQGLVPGVEILAIDGIPIAELSREAMLRALFERESGERVRLLVYSRLLGPLPRFVTLAALPRPPGQDRGPAGPKPGFDISPVDL